MDKENLVPVLHQFVSNTLDLDSSDSEDEDILIYITTIKKSITARPRVNNYIENVVRLYSSQEFKTHFRMNRRTFEYILRLILPDLQKKKKSLQRQGRKTIHPEKQFLLALWMFSTPDSYRSVCDRFNVGRATAIRTVRRVVKALVKLKSIFIKWPNHQQARSNVQIFKGISGFPKVIGIIDGTHIKIAAPKENSNGYINRKNFHSMQLQVVCDHTRKFIHCYVGQPGSVHNQRVFRLSPLMEMLNNDEYFPENTHLLGDAAYSLHNHLMVPFRDNGHLTLLQRNYNYCLSSTRMTVERSIGLLKGRFRSLLDRLDMKRIDLIPHYILTCCILRNICIYLTDLIEEPILINRDEPIQNQQNNLLRRAAERKRQNISNSLLLRI